jgi:hypothetical protein
VLKDKKDKDFDHANILNLLGIKEDKRFYLFTYYFSKYQIGNYYSQQSTGHIIVCSHKVIGSDMKHNNLGLPSPKKTVAALPKNIKLNFINN